jgi:hypothetical protein
MDNDEAGLQYNEKLSSIYRLPNISIPKGYPKDISDCIYRYGTNKARRIMKKLLSKKFNSNRHHEDSIEFLSHLKLHYPGRDMGNPF